MNTSFKSLNKIWSRLVEETEINETDASYLKIRRLQDEDNDRDPDYDSRGFRPVYSFDIHDEDDNLYEEFPATIVFHDLELAKEAAKEFLKEHEDCRVVIYEEEENEHGDSFGEPVYVWGSESGDRPFHESVIQNKLTNAIEHRTKFSGQNRTFSKYGDEWVLSLHGSPLAHFSDEPGSPPTRISLAGYPTLTTCATLNAIPGVHVAIRRGTPYLNGKEINDKDWFSLDGSMVGRLSESGFGPRKELEEVSNFPEWAINWAMYKDRDYSEISQMKTLPRLKNG